MTDLLTGLVNPNDPTEADLLAQAKAQVAKGSAEGDVADRLSNLVHQYRASLATRPSTSPTPETAGDIAAGAIASGYQGLTAGLGNKITSGIQATGDAITGHGFDYGNRLKENTAVLDEFRANHPYASTALEIAGSLPTIAVGGGADALQAARGARAVTPSIARLAATGAGFGGVAGGAEAIRPGATLGDVGAGALTGAVVGGVAAPVASAALTTIPRAAANIAARMTGRDAGQVADEMLAAQYAKSGATPPPYMGENIPMSAADRELLGVPEQPTPPPTTLMEAGGIPVQKLVRAARNVPNSTAEANTTAFLQQRAAETADRLHEALTVGTGHAPEEAWQTDEALQAAKEAAAKPAYDQALNGTDLKLSARATDDGPTLRELLNRPSAKRAMAYADKLNAEQGTAPLSTRLTAGTPAPVATGQFSPEQWAELVKNNPGLPAQTESLVPMQDLHNLKLRLDEQLGYAKNNGRLPDGTPATNKMLRAIQDTTNQLLDIMDRYNPAYAEARNEWAGASAVQDAMQQGVEDFGAGVRPSEAAANRAALQTDSEREFYDRGMLTAARDVIEKNAANPDLPQASRQVNIVQRLLGNKAQGEKIAGLFPSDAAYQKFLGTMQSEAQYPQTAKYLLNQSSTAAQLAEGKANPGLWRDVALAPVSLYAKARLAQRGLQALLGKARGITPEVADVIANRATATGPAMEALARRYAQMTAPTVRAAQIAGVVGPRIGSTNVAGLVNQATGNNP